MKKIIPFLYILTIALALTINLHAAEWQLYDDFNSGATEPDPKKWAIDDSSGVISIENNMVKIVHTGGIGFDNNSLIFNQNPKTITGIKATMTVTECTGEVRARISSFIGKTGNDYAFTGLEFRANRDFLSFFMPIIGPAPDYQDKGSLFWGRFEDLPVKLNTPFTISMVLTLTKAVYEVEGQGALEVEYPFKLSPSDELFKNLGTRINNESGVGTCTVYFDDVYVLRQPQLPVNNLLLLDE